MWVKDILQKVCRFAPGERRKNKLPSKTGRKRAYMWGRWAEMVACASLILKGYRLLKRNYRCPFGEIDLIMSNRRQLVFVEVKARKNIADGLASINARQQKRIVNAAKSFLAIHPGYVREEIRFDVVVVRPWAWPHHMWQAWNEM